MEKIDLKTITELRLELKVSQAKLARLSGVSAYRISAFELGANSPSEEELQKMYQCLLKIKSDAETKGIDVNKKKIVHYDCSVSKELPVQIKNKKQYYELLNGRDFEINDYSLLLKQIYENGQKKKDNNAPKGIALFSGCGGLTQGFESAGYNIVGHLDIEDSANRIYHDNFPDSELLGTDITKITNEEILSWKTKFKKIDIVIGGPPCQGFSLAGKRDPNDARNELYKYYVNIISILRPKLFVMENVQQMTTMKDSDGNLFIKRIKEAFDSIGYSLNINFVNAADYGVPQTRERVIIIGYDRNLKVGDLSLPTKTEFVGNWRSFRDCAGDLPSLESGEKSTDPLHFAIKHPQHVIDWLIDVPEGHSAHENADPTKRPPSGFNTTYKRIEWDKPCSTISTNFSMISGCRNVHPTNTRSLTIREATRAQSFADEFVFCGRWGDIRKAIGNAVPPILALYIANHLKRIFLQDDKNNLI